MKVSTLHGSSGDGGRELRDDTRKQTGHVCWGAGYYLIGIFVRRDRRGARLERNPCAGRVYGGAADGLLSAAAPITYRVVIE
ncbi:hypothetical protein [Nocardia suismassiliense]|uniref:hypothetical protein n=1 Tax=Nocardia suismassiliense TaxID=2077092 RepID=UPI000D1E8EA7|nr:hypothetical protein [Nocardia suismassiliense]